MKVLKKAVDLVIILLLAAILVLNIVGFVSEIIGTGAFERDFLQKVGLKITDIWLIGGAVLLAFAAMMLVRKRLEPPRDHLP